MKFKFIRSSSGEEYLRDTERRQEEKERLVARYMSKKIDRETFLKEMKVIDSRLDLRRAGERLQIP
jgi:hypothetical protein